MKNLSPSQIIVPAVVAALLVLAGVGIGVALSGDDEGFSGQAARAQGDSTRADRGPHRRGHPVLPRAGRVDPAVRAVLLDIRRAVAQRAPEIAKPIIDRAVKDRRISPEQADRIRQRLGRLQQHAGRSR